MTEPEGKSGSPQGNSPEGKSGQVQGLEVEVGGEKKVISPEKAAELLGREATLTQKEQKLASVLQACDRYGTDPDTYVKQAEAAFLAVNKAIEAGLVDEQGNLVESKPPAKSGQDHTPNLGVENPPGEVNRVDETITKALKSLAERVDALKEDNDRLIRLNLQRDLQERYKDLDARDIAELFTIAQREPSKSLDEHAKAMVESKKGFLQRLEKDFAKKYGVDLEEWEKRNKLSEEEARSPGAIFKGKKFSFRGGENTVSPREAMIEFMRKQKGAS